MSYNIARFAFIPKAIAEQNPSIAHVRNLLIAAGIVPHAAPPVTAAVNVRSGARFMATNSQFSVHANDKWRMERLVQQVRESIGATHPDVNSREFLLTDAGTGRAVRTNEELDRAIAANRSSPGGTWMRYTLDKSAKAKPRAAPPTLAEALNEHAARTRPLQAVAAKMTSSVDYFQRFVDGVSKGMGEASVRSATFGKDGAATRAAVTDLLHRNVPELNSLGVKHVQYVSSAFATDLAHLAGEVHGRVGSRAGDERQRAFEAHVRRSEVWPELKQWFAEQKAPLSIPQCVVAAAESTPATAASIDAKIAPPAQHTTNISDIHVVIQDKLPDWTTGTSATATSNNKSIGTAMEGRCHVKERGFESLQGIGNCARRHRHRHHHHHGPVGQWLHERVYGEEPAHADHPPPKASANGSANGYYYPYDYPPTVAGGVVRGTAGVAAGTVYGAGAIAGGAVYGAGAITRAALSPFVGNGMLDDDLTPVKPDATAAINCDSCGGHGKKGRRHSADMSAQIGKPLYDTEFVPFKPLSATVATKRVGEHYGSPHRGRSSASQSPSGRGSRSASSSSGSSSGASSRSVSPTLMTNKRIGTHYSPHHSRSSSSSPVLRRSHSVSPSHVASKIAGAARIGRGMSPTYQSGSRSSSASSRSPSPLRTAAKISGERLSERVPKAPLRAGLVGERYERGDELFDRDLYAIDRDLRPIRSATGSAPPRYDSPPPARTSSLDKPVSRAALSSAVQKVGSHMKMSQASITFVNRIPQRGAARSEDYVYVEIEGMGRVSVDYGEEKTVVVHAGARKIRVTHKGKTLVPMRSYSFQPSTIYTCLMSSVNLNGALVFLEAPHLTTVNTAIRAITDPGMRMTLVDSANGNKEYRLSDTYTDVPASATSVRIAREDGTREYKQIALQHGGQYTIGAGIEGSSTWMHPVLDFEVKNVNGVLPASTTTAAAAAVTAVPEKKGINFLV